jgi:glucose-6-phosphate isomerase
MLQSTPEILIDYKQWSFVKPIIDQQINQDLDKFKLFLTQKKYKNLVVIGIGGSSLGAKLLASLNQDYQSCVEFVDYVNQSRLNELAFSLKELETTLFLVQSKSGFTLETKTVYSFFKDLVIKSQLEVKDHFVIVTDQGSELYKQSLADDLEVYTIPTNIGGRFSVLTYMGLLAAVFCKVDTDELFKGARLALDSDCLAKLSKMVNKITDQNLNQLVLVNYNHELLLFGEWLTQLISESLGKDGVQITPICGVFPRDQHSLLQMIVGGVQNKLVVCIPPVTSGKNLANIPGFNFNFDQLIKAQYEGTVIDIKKNQEVYEQFLDLNKQQLCGYLIVFFELLVVSLGQKMGVNPFDQPSVEGSKIITKQILKI